jgi:ribosome maturation factor RimP
MQDRLNSEVRQEIEAAAESSGCELVHVELRGGQLQVTLDRPEGITISDCEQVAKKLSAALDALDFGSSSYTLEVSSPGLDRKLYGPRDYRRFAGHLARFTWSDPERGKRTDIGRIGDFAEGQEEVTLSMERNVTLTIPIDTVQEARLEIEI